MDGTPTSTSIIQLELRVQGELEQVAHLEGGSKKKDNQQRGNSLKDRSGGKIKGVEAKKYVEDEEGTCRGDAKEKDSSTGWEGKDQPKCRFCPTDHGCTKGRECILDHNQQDDCRKCYSCGSVGRLDLASVCP